MEASMQWRLIRFAFENIPLHKPPLQACSVQYRQYKYSSSLMDYYQEIFQSKGLVLQSNQHYMDLSSVLSSFMELAKNLHR